MFVDLYLEQNIVVPVVSCASHPVSPSHAAQHEKYTSQLQLGLKAFEARVKDKQQVQSPEKSKEAVSNAKLPQKAERKALSLTGINEPLHNLSLSRAATLETALQLA